MFEPQIILVYRGPDGKTRQFFGPYAYRYEDEDAAPGGDVANTHFRAVDYAGFDYHYLDEEWFKVSQCDLPLLWM